MGNPPPGLRVAFYVELRFFEPILEPVRSALPMAVETLATADGDRIVEFRPDVLVLGAPGELARFRRDLPGTWIGLVDHGLLRKGRVRRLQAATARAGAGFDFICAADEATAGMYRLSSPSAEMWVTGSPLLDSVFRGDPPRSLPLDTGQPTILFAPTWNLGLSAAPVLGPRLAEYVRGDGPPINIVIKPHPNIARRRPRWMRWWRDLAARDERVHLVGDVDADVTLFMPAADLLISDASSSILHFLAMDRPIVRVINPDHRWDPEFDPDDICWQWRDVGPEVHDPDELAAAVARSLAAPDEYAAARRRYAETLFDGRRDGRNAQRIADGIVALAGRGRPNVPAAGGSRTTSARGRRAGSRDLPAPARALRARARDWRRRMIRQGWYVTAVRGNVEALRLWATRLGVIRARGARR